jgi:RNA polymerase sigma-70 factor, ECF subfamily
MRTRRLDPDRAVQHLDRLYAAALAMCRDRDTAEDLVQEAYARALARPRTLYREDEVGYLLRTLRNCWIDQIRTRQRRPALCAIPDDFDAPDPFAAQPEDALAYADVLALIGELPPYYRDALIAVDVLGLSYQQAATALDVPIGTVMGRLHRGRARVAERLEPAREPEPALAA